MRLVISVAFIIVTCGVAQAQGVDWKVYGPEEFDGQESICLYDAGGVVKGPDRRIKVWTKCLSVKDIMAIDNKGDLGKKIAETAADKIAKKYIPPFTMLKEHTSFQLSGVVILEVAANIADIKPQARVLYELNCAERMIRALSIQIRINNELITKDKPHDWVHAPPETNGNSLLLMLCQP
jgi:hypothetical protein